ncbi:MAG: YbhB/YbcL family Raf kinase inhibitor-like protein [Bacteroidetes bacterium]|nr:YbhB/YbcL family Raf kinase inhibitor-like protein [Bacteroidota bacterium]
MKIFILMTLPFIASNTLNVMSPAFESSSSIPMKYTCEGQSISPPLTIKKIPENTKTLALIMDDPDAPNGTFDHWIMWNIPVTENIEENTAPGTQGLNGRKENKYTGPCPPNGIHHYHFKIYALDTELDLPANSDKQALIKAMKGHILADGELVGLYKKQK